MINYTFLDIVIGVLGGLIVSGIGRIIIYYILVKANTYCGDAIFLSYDKFKSLYSIAPDKYELYNWQEVGPCVSYKETIVRVNEILGTRDVSSHQKCRIYFRHYLEWVRVKLLFRRYEKLKSEEKSTKLLEQYLQSAKRDIDKYNGNFVNETEGIFKASNTIDRLDKELSFAKDFCKYNISFTLPEIIRAICSCKAKDKFNSDICKRCDVRNHANVLDQSNPCCSSISHFVERTYFKEKNTEHD